MKLELTSKLLGSLFLVSLCACTPRLELERTRWNGQGRFVSIESSKRETRSFPKIVSSKETIQQSTQTIAGYEVENSFHKIIYNEKNQPIFQSSALLPQPKEKTILRAKALDEGKNQTWTLFLSKNPNYQTWRIEKPIHAFFSDLADKEAQFAPHLRAFLNDTSGELYEVVIGKNGDLLSTRRLGTHFLDDQVDIDAFVFPKGPLKSLISQVQLLKQEQPEGLSNLHLEVTTQSPKKIHGNQNLDFQPPDERFDQVQSFYFSDQILNWLMARLQLDGSFKLQIVNHVGYPENTNTAFYFQNQIRLGSGDDKVFSKMQWDPSIVMHETSHAVIDQVAHLPFEGQGGSLNEGFADYFTCAFLQSPYLGEQSYKKAKYKRTVENPLLLSQVSGALYHDSALVSSFFWSLQGLLDREKSMDLALKILNRLGPTSNFADFRLAAQEQVRAVFAGDDLLKAEKLMRERELL